MRNTFVPRAAGIVAALLLILPSPGAADVVELKDGTRLEGTYAGGTAETIRLETADGVREVARADAASITFTAPKPPVQAPAQQADTLSAPAGSLLLVRMQNQVSSKNKAGTKFAAILETDLVAANAVLAKAGTKVYGRVEAAKQAGRMVGKSSLQLTLTEINLGGTNVPIATSDFAEAGQSSFKKTARNTMVGAGVGAAFDDAGKGAAIGAGASVIREGQSVTVPVNAILEFRLVQPLQVKVAQK